MLEPNKWYELKEAEEYLPLSVFQIKKFIHAGKLKASFWGDATGKRYKIKGSWLIDFLVKFEDNN